MGISSSQTIKTPKNSNMATIVLGAQWGDEGKGKLVDILCPTVKLCARAQGGNNAGHTIVANGVTYDFHLLPSGLINPDCVNLIGAGVVCHIPAFFKELNDLEAKGLENVQSRIFISDRAQIVFDLHQIVDGLEEVELGGKSVGTTRKGIGPSYSTKAARSGVRISEIFKADSFNERLRKLAAGYKKRYGDLLTYDVEEEISRYNEYREKLATAYIDPETGAELESFPADLEVLGRVQPKYVELKGWEKPITGAKSFYDLPKAAREYVEFIEEFVGVKVKYIGTGPGREAMISR